MPIVRFKEWDAYFRIEHETPSKSELILAQIAALISNYICKKRYKASDFLPEVKEDKKQFSKKEGANFFKRLVKSLGGKI